MQNPCIDCQNAIIYILRYLKKAPGQGLLYEDKENTRIYGYCDDGWAESPMDKCSTTGIVFSLEETLFVGKARDKMWLFDLVLKLNIGQ